MTETKNDKESEELEKLVKRTYEKIVGIILVLVGLLSLVSGLGGLVVFQILFHVWKGTYPFGAILKTMYPAFTTFSWIPIFLGLIMMLTGFLEYSEKET